MNLLFKNGSIDYDIFWIIFFEYLSTLESKQRDAKRPIMKLCKKLSCNQRMHLFLPRHIFECDWVLLASFVGLYSFGHSFCNFVWNVEYWFDEHSCGYNICMKKACALYVCLYSSRVDCEWSDADLWYFWNKVAHIFLDQYCTLLALESLDPYISLVVSDAPVFFFWMNQLWRQEVMSGRGDER